MKKKHIQSAAATVALLCAFAPLAHAAIDVKGAVDVDVDMGDKVEMGMKANAGMGANGTGDAKMGMEADGEVHMMNNGETMMGGEEMMEDEEHERGLDRAQMMADEHALEILGDVELRVNLRKEEGDEHPAGTPEVDMAGKVRTAHDFEDFVHHKAKGDAHLKSVEVKDGKVEVKYGEPAKLFGFMKTTLTTRVSVDAEDNVEVKYPWYHIFMKKHVSKASMQSNIARAVAAERKAVKEGVATTTIQADVKTYMGIPDIFEIIADELRSARVKAEAEIEAD